MGKKKHKSPKVSPIILSAFEVLNHGLWHYFRSDTSTDLKFAIMHVDQAIELLLKGKVLLGGKSIYKNPKETISIYEAYRIIEQDFKSTVPEKPDLELLHEERNTIQHKYGNPSPETVAFHIEKAMKFIERFSNNELSVKLSDYVSEEYVKQILP